MHRPVLLAVFALFAARPVFAGPRDEVLRVAPPDAALVVLVQNAREHVRAVVESPFAEWFPSTAIGKKLLDSPDLKGLREAAPLILGELGTTPKEFVEEILGDAVAFAYSPAPPGRPDEERSVILIRPRKTEALAKLIDRINEIQTKVGEVKGVARKEHAGGAYFERRKPAGGAEFYCFVGGVFAFSGSEADVKAVIDRDRAAPAAGPPELVARLTKLGVADAAAMVLVNPRALDAEVKAKVAAAKPEARRFLGRFAECWAALDSAAVYLDLGTDLEIGLSLRFQPEKLPASARAWLTGPKTGMPAEGLIPRDALVGVCGRLKAVEFIDLVASLVPLEPGKPGVKEWIGHFLGPVVGRDNLPLVLDALGPNWAVWAEPPAGDGFLPTLVAAVEVSGEGDTRAKVEKALLQAVEFGFQTTRVAYNARHADQIEVREEKDPKTGAVIKSLVNDKGFPPGFRPSFALTKGYLVLATSPDAIRRFALPTAGAPANGSATVARLSGVRCREYLQTHGPKLAKFLADLGVGEEKPLREVFGGLADVLELVDSAEIVTRGDEAGVRIALRIKPAKPLKK